MTVIVLLKRCEMWEMRFDENNISSVRMWAAKQDHFLSNMSFFDCHSQRIKEIGMKEKFIRESEKKSENKTKKTLTWNKNESR